MNLADIADMVRKTCGDDCAEIVAEPAEDEAVDAGVTVITRHGRKLGLQIGPGYYGVNEYPPVDPPDGSYWVRDLKITGNLRAAIRALAEEAKKEK